MIETTSRVFCDIAAPVPVDHLFTYELPAILRERVHAGCRVWVPFGSRKLTGVVLRTYDEPPAHAVREVLKVLDEQPVLDAGLLQLAE